MKEIYIKKLFYYNRICYPVEIKHNANLSWAIPKRSTVFATLSENITDQKILENCFKLKYIKPYILYKTAEFLKSFNNILISFIASLNFPLL